MVLSSQLLILFDIDGTLLLTSDPLYGEALAETVQEIYGLEVSPRSLSRLDHPGETAMAGLRLLLRVEGLDDAEIDVWLKWWCVRHAERYVELLAAASTDHWEPAPHAHETLTELEQDHRLGLLTGNAAVGVTTGAFGSAELADADAVISSLAELPEALSGRSP
jgi:phosphoglycolate phosphatase-like HAD superfamily hydrolase